MTNRDTKAARDYHEVTKLSYINLRNKPPLYKSYSGLPTVPLPTDLSHPRVPTLDALAGVDHGDPSVVDLAALSRLLLLTAGLVRKGSLRMAREIQYRAAASAGALFPIEVYLVCRDLPGLQAGVYHFSPGDFALTRLRCGDYRSEVARYAGGEGSVSDCAAALIFTAVFWRSAWKYRARAYRYCFWDGGTMAANMLAAASAEGLSARVLAGFADHEVNQLVGVDGDREASLCLLTLGTGGDSQPDVGSVDLTPLPMGVEGPYPEEIVYPEIGCIHSRSSLTIDEVEDWRGAVRSRPTPAQRELSLQVPSEGEPSSRTLSETVLGRGSTRRFAPVAIGAPQFNAIFDSSTKGVPADFLSPGEDSLLGIYIIVNAVEGMAAGSYFLSAGGLHTLKQGSLRQEAGHLCFEQALGADASVVVFFLADLDKVLQRFGNRGYLAAQLEAGILGGRIYLSAHSLGLGATGLTFYDDDVTEFFSPHAEAKTPMFVVALGVTAERNRVRPFRSRVGVLLDALSRGAAVEGA